METVKKFTIVSTVILVLYSAREVLQLLMVLDAEGVFQIIIPKIILVIFGIIAAVLFWQDRKYSVHIIFAVWFLALLIGVNIFGPPGSHGVFISLQSIASAVVILLLAYYVVISHQHDKNT